MGMGTKEAKRKEAKRKDAKQNNNRKPPTSSDMSRSGFSTALSTVTELSEIERLRMENNRLREELENASQLSSKVSNMYANRLKLENNRLREELENTSQLTKTVSGTSHQDATMHLHNLNDMVYLKSNLGTLLERDNETHSKKGTCEQLPARQTAMTGFGQHTPVAHLINGEDFDGDSITTYSPIGGDEMHRIHFERDAECDVGPDFLKKTCTRIATTTRTVAVQMRTVAEDLRNERREKGSCSIPVPGCFAVCARRGKSNGSMTTRKKSNSMSRREFSG